MVCIWVVVVGISVFVWLLVWVVDIEVVDVVCTGVEVEEDVVYIGVVEFVHKLVSVVGVQVGKQLLVVVVVIVHKPVLVVVEQLVPEWLLL